MKPNRAQRTLWPLILIGFGLLLIGGAFFYYLAQGQSQAQVDSGDVSGASVPYPDVPRVSLADARAAWETGGAVFVDVRAKMFYDSGHIEGAISIPLEELPQRINELKPDEWIIPYCT